MPHPRRTMLFLGFIAFLGGSGGCQEAQFQCSATGLCRDPFFPSPTQIQYTINRFPDQQVRNYDILIMGEPYPDDQFKQAFFEVKQLGDQTLNVTLILETFDPTTLEILTNPQFLITQYPSGEIVGSSSKGTGTGDISPNPDYAEAASIGDALIQQFKSHLSGSPINPALAFRIHKLLRDRLPIMIASVE